MDVQCGINKGDYRTVITLKEAKATAASFSATVLTVSMSGSVKAYRPEQENQWALPQHEFGLDVIVLVGAVRYP